jgi:2',3'-cyclic-nucleotide 2'-phosphodiesterase
MSSAKRELLNMHDKIYTRVLCIGDVVGTPGRVILQKYLPQLVKKYAIDAVIVNGENSADGKGVTPRIMRFFKHIGVDIVTSGNHIWQKKEIFPYLTEHKDLLRPINFPSECPGVGVTLFTSDNNVIGVLNVQGRIFMREMVSCPFRAAESALTFLASRTRIVIVDMHAETTSEKMALAWFLDGKVSAVVGTHTHVQTADERVLPGGTAFITDLGMCGALNGMLGMKKEPIIRHMMTQMPTKFEVDDNGPFVLSGVYIDIDTTTGKALALERIRIIDDELHITSDAGFID